MKNCLGKKKKKILFICSLCLKNFTIRLGQHVGTATQPCQADTVKPVGRHFCLPGHQAHCDLVMLPIEIVSAIPPQVQENLKYLEV